MVLLLIKLPIYNKSLNTYGIYLARKIKNYGDTMNDYWQH